MKQTLATAALLLAYLAASVPAVCLCNLPVGCETPAKGEAATSCCVSHAVAVDESEPVRMPQPCVCAPPIEADAIPAADVAVPSTTQTSLIAYPVLSRTQPLSPPVIPASESRHLRLCVWRC